MTEEAVVALGSNIPPRMALLREALFLMEKLPETRLADRSKVYETEPAGGPPSAPPPLIAVTGGTPALRLPPSVSTHPGASAARRARHSLRTDGQGTSRARTRSATSAKVSAGFSGQGWRG